MGVWATRQRTSRRKGILSEERAAALETVDSWMWDPVADAWQAAHAALTAYAAEHGTTEVPAAHVCADGLRLGRWIRRQRETWQGGRLSDSRAKALQALPGWSWGAPSQAPVSEHRAGGEPRDQIAA